MKTKCLFRTIVVLLLCFCMIQGLSFAADCQHILDWEIDDNTHSYACILCGYVTVNETAHTYSDGDCIVCGYACEHPTLSGLKSDATNHWKVCSTCNLKLNISKHNYLNGECTVCGYDCKHDLDWEIDANTHSRACSICGYVSVKEAVHTYSNGECTVCGYKCKHDLDWEIDANTHSRACTLCGYVSVVEKAHAYSKGECTVCGYKCKSHDLDWEMDANTHSKACTICGYVSVAEKAHTYSNGECTVCGYKCEHDLDWEIDANTHSKACTICGYVSVPERAHTYSNGECTVCGYECEHDLDWEIDANTHSRACTICGYVSVAEKAHTYSNGECTVCGYKCEHPTLSGWKKDGTNHWKECTKCNVITTAKEAHKYDGNKCIVCGYEKACTHTPSGWKKDGTNHWKECTKCNVIATAKEAHKYDGNKCTVCGYEKACTHTPSGWKNDGTNHWKVCTKCNVITTAKEAHKFSGNKCTVCGYERACTHTPSGWKNDGTNHWKVCTKCNVITTAKEAHKFSGNKCTVCGYEKACTHTPSGWKHDETNHWKVCTSCNVVTTAKEAHKFDGNVCTVCGYERACTHTPSNWKYNSTKHWKECTICGEYTVEKESHTFKNDKCTVCGYERDSDDNDTDISVSPRSGSYVSYGDRIKITAEDDDGIDYVEYYWNDDDSTKKYSDEFTVKVPSEEGKNYLYVRAEDERGNRTSYERFVYYVEEDYYPGNADNKGKLNDKVKELRVEIGNMDDRIVYEPGEEIEYYVDYYNGTSSKISNVKIVVEVPNSNFKMVEVENNGTKTTKKATWNLGTLKAKEDGRVYFTMEYTGKLDNDLVFNVEAKIYKSSKVQDTSFTRNMVYNEDSNKEGSHLAYCSGYPDGRFKPDGTITRAEMATMIARMVGINVDNYAYKNAFSDVSADFWAAGAIQACVDNGLVGAYSYGRFEPELPATRGMISYAIAKVLGVENVEPIYIRAKDTVNSSAMIPVEQMLRLNIIDGYSDGTAKPDKYITRSEAVVIINNYLFRGELLGNNNNLGYVGPQANEFKQFTDLYYGHWAFNHIMEATHDHDYVRTFDGNETFRD